MGEVPRGTGIIIQANSDVEVFDNDIYGNGTVNLSIVTYGYDTEDENYYPHPRSIQIHGNRFGDGVSILMLGRENWQQSYLNCPMAICLIFFGMVFSHESNTFGQPADEKLIIKNNGDATFLTLNPIKFICPFLIQLKRTYLNMMAK